MNATCAPLPIARAAAAAAITVLPQPTSPCTSLAIGVVTARSRSTSSSTRRCALVRLNGSAASSRDSSPSASGSAAARSRRMRRRSSISDSWCASNSSNARRRCAGWRPVVRSASWVPTGGRCTNCNAAHKRRQPGALQQAFGQQLGDPARGQRLQCAIHQRAQPPLRQAFGGRVDRRQGLRQWLAQADDATVLGMHDLESQRAAPYLAVAAQPRAARQAFALGVRKIKESQRQRPGSIGQPHQQRTAAPEYDLGQQHLAFDHGAHAGLQCADRHHAGSVLVAQRQHEQDVLRLLDTEARELRRQRAAHRFRLRATPRFRRG